MRILEGTSSASIALAAVSSSNPMNRITGKVSGDWTIYYSKNGGASTQLVGPTVTELDNTNMAGDYILSCTSAMLNTAGELTIHAKVASAAHITRVVDVYASSDVQSGCEDAIDAKFGFNVDGDVEATLDSETVTVGTNNDKTGYALSAASIDAIWDEDQTGHLSANSLASYLSIVITSINVYTGADGKCLISTAAQDLSGTLHVDAKAISGETTAADNVEANIGNLDAAVSGRSSHSANDVTAGTTVAAAVTAIANGVTNATINTAIGALNDVSTVEVEAACEDGIDDKFTFASGDVVATLSGEEVTTDTASRNASKANVAGLSTAINLAVVDTVVDAIKVKTDNLSFSGNDVLSTLDSEEVTTDAASRTASKADVSGLATGANLAVVDTVVDLINGKTTNLPTDPADQSAVEAHTTAVGVAIVAEVNANETKIDIIDTVVDAIKANTDNWPHGFEKNVAFSDFMFVMTDTDGDPATGLTVAANRSIDGAAFGVCDNAVSELSNGVYKINLSGADLNGDMIALMFTSAGAATSIIMVKTEV